jgi:ketosteroid isomerase-like protein
MQRSKTSVAGWALVALLSAGCQQPAPAPAAPAALTEEDRTAITGQFQAVAQAVRAANWDAFVAQFDDDIVFQPANGPTLRGREAVKAWAAAGPKATAAFDFTNVEINGAGAFAYATSAVNMAFEGMPADPGKQLVVLRKNADGQWKTVAVSFNSDTPMPGMPGPPPPATTR